MIRRLCQENPLPNSRVFDVTGGLPSPQSCRMNGRLSTVKASHRSDLLGYQDLIYPTLKAVAALGGLAQAREIMKWVLGEIGASDADVAIPYEHDPRSVLMNRLEWARS